MLIHCLTMTGLITCAASAAAHHSFAAEFSYELFGSREGKVVEVHFVNPHAHIFFAVKNDYCVVLFARIRFLVGQIAI